VSKGEAFIGLEAVRMPIKRGKVRVKKRGGKGEPITYHANMETIVD
jgi:hypothetical protein